MRQILLGRPVARFVPLPVEMTPRANWKPFSSPAALREVPFVPTPQHVVDEMLHIAGVSDRDVIYDLGCGDGRIVITAARDYGARGVGVDLDPERIRACWQSAADAGVENNVRFLQQSFFDVDFSEASIVTLYLLPWVNAILRPKLLTQLRPGSRIISHAFSMHDWMPDRIVRIADKRVIYLWMVPAQVGGSWSATLRLPNGRTHPTTLELEQEFQTIVGQARFDDELIPLDNPVLFGDHLRFTLRSPVKPRVELTYTCRIEADTMRGQASNGHGVYEIRGRRTGRSGVRYDA